MPSFSDEALPEPLSTERLSLLPTDVARARRLLDGDFDGLARAPGWPHADTMDALRAFAAHGSPGDTGPWLIVVAETGEVVGECGWTGPPGLDGEVEIGYGLAASARGRGIATEAVRALLGWVGAQPGVRRVLIETELTNVASRNMAEKLGFTLDRVVEPHAYYTLDLG
jgi:RimJ/RimL family protein N-acetyltransferase